MPTLSIDLTGDGARGLITGTQIIGPGHLESIVAYVKDGSTTPGNTIISASLTDRLGQPDTKTATPLIGYVYNGGDIAWDGHMVTHEGDTLLVQLRSEDTPTVRITARTLKRDP